jgi:hypothetical protein
MNLGPCQLTPEPELNEESGGHLNKEGLELAACRVNIADKGAGHERRDVCCQIAESRIKDEAVNRFVEGFGQGEGCYDDHGPQEGEDGAGAFDDAEDVYAGVRETRVHGGHVGVGASDDTKVV